MDYETKPVSREGLRFIAKSVRKLFGCKSDYEPFPVLFALEQLSELFPNTNYEIVEDTELPANVFACCMMKPKGGFIIYIKQTVYDGAYYNNNVAFLSFICHEICHVVLFYIGFTPVSNRTIKEIGEIPPYRSIEWQAKALCGEVQIPYEATIGLKTKAIMEKYTVTEASAKYRIKLDKNRFYYKI
jgi:hypothetical protein